jgi:hypothetical protein
MLNLSAWNAFSFSTLIRQTKILVQAKAFVMPAVGRIGLIGLFFSNSGIVFSQV